VIKELKIKEINPPEGVAFSLKRRVIIEKYARFFSAIKTFDKYKKTILNSGEFLWIIDCRSLNIERYVISHVPDRYDKDGRIFLFNRQGMPLGINIGLADFIERVNSNISLYLSGKEVCGEKLVCSSERDVLKVLKFYIPRYNKLIQNGLNKKSTRHDKRIGKQSRMKKLDKLHKKNNKILKRELILSSFALWATIFS
jgi:hypothetical protein